MNDDGQAAANLANSGLAADLSKFDRIHSGPRHTLFRGRISHTPIVVKTPSAGQSREGAAASLRHEHELLREFNLAGIVRVLGVAPAGDGPALLMEDAGETNLAALIRAWRLSIATFLDIAVQLADAVAQLHRVRIIHRDIHPGNVIWNSATATATLCDFAIARTFSALAMENPNSRRLEGTLAYMSPEQRYQSATALADDLREARQQWLRSTSIAPFPLALSEIPHRLNIPDKLYGRDEALQSLADAFERTRAGGRQLVLVTGGPGIGKSALAGQLRPAVSDGHGYFAAGKFDQLQRSVPFSGLAQAQQNPTSASIC